MIKLIVSDMDGTLLGQGSTISKENQAAIKWAQQNGVVFAIATGRHLNEARPLLEEADISCHLMSVNGAAIYTENNVLQQSLALNKATTKEIIKICQKYPDMLIELTTIDDIISDNPTLRKRMVREYILSHLESDVSNVEELIEQHASYLKATFVPSLLEYIEQVDEKQLLKILVSYIGQDNAIETLKKELQPFTNVTMSSSHISNIEITALEATKGNAVTKLANELNIPLSQVMAIGDNMNDYSMLSIVGYGVAMGNAITPLKNIAAHVSKKNDEHGVAAAIYHYLPKEVSNG